MSIISIYSGTTVSIIALSLSPWSSWSSDPMKVTWLSSPAGLASTEDTALGYVRLSDRHTSFLNPLLSPPPRLLIWSPPTPRRPPLTCHTLGRVAHARVTGRALHSARLVSPAHLCTSRSRQHSSFQIPTLALFCGLDLNVYKTKEISEKLQLSF